LRAQLHPVIDALAIELQRLRLGARVVVPQHLDERAVARPARIGPPHADGRPLLRSCPPQTYNQHYRINPFSADRFGRLPLARPAMPPIAFSIFFIWMNCFSRRFTSSPDVPEPFAIRLRRWPLIS